MTLRFATPARAGLVAALGAAVLLPSGAGAQSTPRCRAERSRRRDHRHAGRRGLAGCQAHPGQHVHAHVPHQGVHRRPARSTPTTTPLTTHVQRSGATPHTVVVKSGAAAAVALHWNVIPSGSTPCRLARWLRVTPPGGTSTLRVYFHDTACRGRARRRYPSPIRDRLACGPMRDARDDGRLRTRPSSSSTGRQPGRARGPALAGARPAQQSSGAADRHRTAQRPHLHLPRRLPPGRRPGDDRRRLAERKRWWRNLSDAAPVEIWLAGVRRAGTGQAHGDEHAGVTVEIHLDGAAGASTPDIEKPRQSGASATARAEVGVERRPGHGRRRGSPFAAKFAQAARMLAASASWSAFSGRRTARSAGRRGTGSPTSALRSGASRVPRRAAARCRRRTRRRTSARACDVQRSTCSAGQAKFASETSMLRASDRRRVGVSGYSAAIADALAWRTRRARDAITLS